MERPEHKLNQTIRICLVCEGNNTLKGSFTTGTPHFWPCCSVWYLQFNVLFATLSRKCYFSDLTYVFCLPVEIKRLPSMKPTYKSNISVDYGADLTYIPVRGVARGCKHSSLAQIKVGPGARCTELRRFFWSYTLFETDICVSLKVCVKVVSIFILKWMLSWQIYYIWIHSTKPANQGSSITVWNVMFSDILLCSDPQGIPAWSLHQL